MPRNGNAIIRWFLLKKWRVWRRNIEIARGFYDYAIETLMGDGVLLLCKYQAINDDDGVDVKLDFHDYLSTFIENLHAMP